VFDSGYVIGGIRFFGPELLAGTLLLSSCGSVGRF